MNKRQRLLSAAAAATLGLAGLIGAAAPAANAAPTVVDNNDGSVTVSGITNSMTESVHFCPTSVAPNACVPATQLYGASANGTYTGGSSVFPGPVALPAGTYTVSVYNGTSSTGLSPVTITGGGGGGGGSSSDSSTAPAPVIQQFGMPATGTCDEAQPDGLNWSGVANGGWGISWAQWVNGGTGGAVCTRTLVYSTVQSKWVVT